MEKRLGELKIRRRINTTQTTVLLKSAKILRRVLETCCHRDFNEKKTPVKTKVKKETCEKKENNNGSNNDALLCWYKRPDQTQNRILFLYLGRFVFVYFVYFGWGVEPVACPYRRGSPVITSVILPSLECNYFAPLLKLLLEGFILSCIQWFQKNFFCCPH